MSFLEGHRITGKLCSQVCNRPSGCNNAGPQYAGKVTESERPSSFDPEHRWVEVEITSCPERPEVVGRKRKISTRRIEHLD